MTDQEKSVMLAKAMGWDISLSYNQQCRYITSNGSTELGDVGILPYRNEGDLYDPANMALAWRVLNWAITSELGSWAFLAWWIDLGRLSPADAQRLWLDKILELLEQQNGN